ncbi:MAG: hypothetical protein FWD34_07750 [Oscillospiraceae bacterium]|nr:hypothetical protein [Oscillospiraceae bacterium]
MNNKISVNLAELRTLQANAEELRRALTENVKITSSARSSANNAKRKYKQSYVISDANAVIRACENLELNTSRACNELDIVIKGLKTAIDGYSKIERDFSSAADRLSGEQVKYEKTPKKAYKSSGAVPVSETVTVPMANSTQSRVDELYGRIKYRRYNAMDINHINQLREADWRELIELIGKHDVKIPIISDLYNNIVAHRSNINRDYPAAAQDYTKKIISESEKALKQNLKELNEEGLKLLAKCSEVGDYDAWYKIGLMIVKAHYPGDKTWLDAYKNNPETILAAIMAGIGITSGGLPIVSGHNAEMFSKCLSAIPKMPEKPKKMVVGESDSVSIGVLDDEWIAYNPLSVSGLTEEQLIKALSQLENNDKNYNTDWLSQYAGVFLEMEKEYGINALFLAGLVGSEGGWDENERCIREGNNLYGMTTREEDPNSYFNGQVHIKCYLYREDSIRDAAAHLANSYLKPGGQYYKETDDGSFDFNNFVLCYVFGPYATPTDSEFIVAYNHKIGGIFSIIKRL